MTVREHLRMVKNSTQFLNPHKTEGFREGIEMAEKICDEAISYREPLKLNSDGESRAYCARCGAELDNVLIYEHNITNCPYCGQAILYEFNER